VAVNFDAVLRLVAKVDGLQNVQKLQGTLGTIEGTAKKARKAFTDVTSSATWQAAAVGAAAIGAGLAVSMRTAMDFEKAMSGVAAKVGGNSDQIAELNQLARDLGRTTQFSAKQAAEGMDFLAMAGFKANEIVAAMPGLLDLAAAGNLELGAAADIASNILGGLGMEASETTRVADVLAKAASSSNVSVEMLGETFKFVAPVAAQAGVSLEELAAATGLLGDAGIQGSEAGTGLRSVLLRLAAPPAEAAKALAKLGVATKDSAGNMRPFGDILADVDRRMKELNLGSAEQLEIQNDLYGKTAIASGAILQQAAATGALDEKTKLLLESQGAASEMAKTMNDNVAGAFTRLMSAVEGLQIQLMSGASPALQGMIDGLANTINVVTDLMERFPLLTGTVVALAAAFVALVAAAPFIAAFISVIGSIKVALAGVSMGAIVAGWAGALVPAIAAIKAAFLGLIGWLASTLLPGLLAFFSGPVGWTVLAVAAVVAMAIAFREPIMKFFGWLGGALADGAKAIGAWAMEVPKFMVQAWTAARDAIRSFFAWFADAVVEGVKALWAIGEPIRQFWAGVWESVKPFVTGYFDFLRGVFQWGLQAAWAIVDTLLIRPWINIWENLIRGPALAAMGWLRANVFQPLAQAFRDAVVTPIQNAWAGLTQILSTAMNGVVTMVRNTWSALGQAFNQYVVTPVQQSWSGLMTSIGELMSGAVNAIVGAWNSVGQGFRQYVAEPISNAWKAVVEFMPRAMRSVADFVQGIWSGMIESVQNAVRGLLRYVAGAINTVAGLINRLIGAFNALPGADIPLIPTIQVPAFAQGGVVSRPTLAVVGDGGEDEYIVPASKMQAASSRFLGGARGSAVIPSSGGSTGPARTTAPQINIRTGPVMQQADGSRWVSVEDFQRGLQQMAELVVDDLRRPEARLLLGTL
jgi:TP901 family phage tail tape measure protein